MRMRRILFVCNHLYGGGAERVLVSLANCFDNKGYDVSIVVFDGKQRYPINDGIQVEEIGDSRSLLRQAMKIRKIVKIQSPEIVISFEYFVNLCTIIGCLFLNRRLIVSERNDPAIVGSGAIKDLLRNWLYRYCDYLVCQTPDAMYYFPESVKEHATVILNPIKTDLPDVWNGERTKEIVAFCRLNKQKNLPLLIDAFIEFEKTHSGYFLSIYGDGEEFDNLHRYIIAKQCEEIVSIYHSRNDIHERVIKSSMFVSSSNYEGLSNSMLEAMSIGLPTICTDCPCGGARMVINDHENGLLVPLNNQNELTKAMAEIADNSELAKRISRNGTKLKNELSIDVIAKQWESLF